MCYKRLQHIHLCTAWACNGSETLSYFLLGDSPEQVSYDSQAENQDQLLPYELAHSEFIFCSWVQSLRYERNIYEVLINSASHSQQYAFNFIRVLRRGSALEDVQYFTAPKPSRREGKARKYKPGQMAHYQS
jgi:hypothetical protein